MEIFFCFSVNPLQASGFMATFPIMFWKVNLVKKESPTVLRTFFIIINVESC